MLVIHVARNASRGRAGERVVTRVMAGDPADERAANTAFRVRWSSSNERRRDGERKGCMNYSHMNSPTLIALPERPIVPIGSY